MIFYTNLTGERARERQDSHGAGPRATEEELLHVAQRELPDGEEAPLAVRKWSHFGLALVVTIGAGASIWALGVIAGPLGAAFGAGVLALYFLLGGLPALAAAAVRLSESRRIRREIRRKRRRDEQA